MVLCSLKSKAQENCKGRTPRTRSRKTQIHPHTYAHPPGVNQAQQYILFPISALRSDPHPPPTPPAPTHTGLRAIRDFHSSLALALHLGFARSRVVVEGELRLGRYIFGCHKGEVWGVHLQAKARRGLVTRKRGETPHLRNAGIHYEINTQVWRT